MNIEITRRAADHLFRPLNTETGPKAEKLLDLRKRLRLRKRELRSSERRARQEKRAGNPS
ncbi:hypothetical protein [Rhizobium leucaenae]|jgi:hypothetical protein|uniref:Uncharacterized protein n=1 Tax=Rhizobium leucaenae TaxID=29450 RepID=A0A7W6ZR44_9HYPH|nr:hypothetical protein [Rhizobium leucaenae]MBB4566728.1 hypothetical protein [Rhizobium leucaenae]MBB6301376.1 hypothetical protein [Rhizobium leucaenae]